MIKVKNIGHDTLIGTRCPKCRSLCRVVYNSKGNLVSDCCKVRIKEL